VQSKSTPLGAVVKFAAGGKARAKKDLAMLAMETYGQDVYVASVCLEANYNQVRAAAVRHNMYFLHCYQFCMWLACAWRPTSTGCVDNARLLGNFTSLGILERVSVLILLLLLSSHVADVYLEANYDRCTLLGV
jgi:hypothetical protein